MTRSKLPRPRPDARPRNRRGPSAGTLLAVVAFLTITLVIAVLIAAGE